MKFSTLTRLCLQKQGSTLRTLRKERKMRFRRGSIAKLQIALMLLFGMTFISNFSASAVENSSTTSTVVSQNACVWWYESFPTELELSSAGAKYEGVDLELTDTDEDAIKLYISGNSVEGEPPAGSFDSNTECTWYRTSLIQGIQVLVDVNGVDVESTDAGLAFSYADALNGDLEGALPGLNLTNTAGAECDAYWSHTSAIQLNALDIGANVATAYADNPPKTKSANSDVDRCSVTLEYSVVIPGDLLPASPGSSATFTLPAVVWTVTASPTVLP